MDTFLQHFQRGLKQLLCRPAKFLAEDLLLLYFERVLLLSSAWPR